MMPLYIYGEIIRITIEKSQKKGGLHGGQNRFQ